MKKVIFLDRDGVINKDPGGWTEHNYVTGWEYFLFLPGSKEAIKKLTLAGYDVVVISNQAGVARGYYTAEKLAEINARMAEEIARSGGRIKSAYYCVHRPDENCGCRKPDTGLFKKAERELGVKARGNFFVGDTETDIEAGKKMGMKTVLVLSGKAKKEEAECWNIKPDYIFNGLNETVDFILSKGD